MRVPESPSIETNFTQNSANDPLSSLSAISYSDTKYPNWSFTSSENPGERILATISKRRARTLCLGTFLSVAHRTNVNYSNKLTENCDKIQQIPDFRLVKVYYRALRAHRPPTSALTPATPSNFGVLNDTTSTYSA